MCIITGGGKQINRLPNFPCYIWFSKQGSNSFGGVALLIHNKFKSKLIDESVNFLLIEIEILNEKIYVGAVYVPPDSSPPFDILDAHKDRNVYIFGDYNAKHESWRCEKRNISGNKLKEWLDLNGFEVIRCTKRTLKKSDSIIDFGISKDVVLSG